jgi:hypothetical protein
VKEADCTFVSYYQETYRRCPRRTRQELGEVEYSTIISGPRQFPIHFMRQLCAHHLEVVRKGVI